MLAKRHALSVEDSTPGQKGKALAHKTSEELPALAKDEEYELTAENSRSSPTADDSR